MARPREFDERTVLDAAAHCFWARGYEATSVKDLMERTGLAAASLYNAYGDKRSMFGTALHHYIEGTIGERLRRCEALPPRDAIRLCFDDILRHSLTDREHKGCMVVNTALELAPHDPEVRKIAAGALRRIEEFFFRCARNGQADGTITRARAADALAQHLLSVLLGARVLARVRPERPLLEGAIGTALTLLDDP